MGERRKSWDKEAQRGKNRTRKKERHTTIPSLLAEQRETTYTFVCVARPWYTVQQSRQLGVLAASRFLTPTSSKLQNPGITGLNVRYCISYTCTCQKWARIGQDTASRWGLTRLQNMFHLRKIKVRTCSRQDVQHRRTRRLLRARGERDMLNTYAEQKFSFRVGDRTRFNS